MLGADAYDLPRHQGCEHDEHRGDEWLQYGVLVARRDKYDYCDVEPVDILLK